MIITNELEVGITYKSLKDICNILDKKYSKSANSRNAILKDIECNYNLERNGNKYTVLEKYDIPKEKIDKRVNNGGLRNSKLVKYDTLMDDLIVNYLYEEDIEEVNVTFNQLFGQDKDIKNNIPLLTGDYKDLLSIGYEEFSKEVSIRKDLVDVYVEKLRKILSKCLETALDRLQRQGIIIWEKNIMVKEYDLETNIAEEELVLEIKLREKEVYEELNITPFQRKNLIINKRFKREVYKKLTYYYVSSYWNIYSIKILDEDKIIQIENVDEIKKELTARFIKSIRQSLLNKKYNNKSKIKNISIGEVKLYEYHPFDSFESLENINDLDKYLFVDYQYKDSIDIMNELFDEENK